MKNLLLAASALVLISTSTHAGQDDRIHPTCWEDNEHGEVHRHCEVIRPDVPRVQRPVLAFVQEPPPAYAEAPPIPRPEYHGPYPNPPGYYGPPPSYFQPGYIPGPLVVFRLGPFRFVIP